MPPTLHLRPLRALSALLLAGLALVLLASAVRAQSGTLAGVVVDRETGETLIGVNVVLEALGAGSATGLDGDYRIPGLATGSYDVTFSYVGYTQQRVTGVEVRAGETTTLDVQLVSEAVDLGGEVVVEARALRNNEAALLRQRQRASAVSDAISSEAMSRSGASDAADALEKVTGASVVGGKYVYVRGLGERYVNTQLNGSTLPSADPDRNAVPLDLFPAGLLDNVVTTKTFTPDLPGTFTGGNVNINTRDFPDAFTASLSLSAGYDSQTSLQGNFLSGNSGGRDWLGSDDGTRAIPAAWQSMDARVPPVSQVRTNADSAAVLDRLSRAFNPVMAPTAADAPLNRSLGLSVGNQVRLFGRPLGFIGSLSYSRDYSGYTGGTTAQYQLTGTVAENGVLENNYDFADHRSTSESLWGGLGTLAYRVHPNHNLVGTVVYNRSGTGEARYQTGTNVKNFLVEDRIFETRTLAWTERSLASGQLRGEHAFPRLGGLRADWTASYAATRQDEPDLRFFANDYRVNRDADGAPTDTAYSITISNYTAPLRYFRDLNEDNANAALNLALPFRLGASTGSVKVGGAVNRQDRTFRERSFVYVTQPNAYRYNGDPATFFTEGIGIVDTTVTGAGATRYVPGNYVQDAFSPSSNYDGRRDIVAVYAMAEVRPLARLRAVGGVRYERTDLEVYNFADRALTERDTTGAIADGDVLPSLNLVYELRPDMNVRAAYGRTLARPTLRELAPFTSFSFIGDPTIIGNPGLRRTQVDNFDLRWEWFTGPGQILAVSGFFKAFENPIELAIISNNDQIQYRNVPSATVLGVEFEARRRFEALPAVPGALELGANLTLADSDVDVPAGVERETILQLDPGLGELSLSRPLQGQSPYVVNLDATFTHPDRGTALSFYYNAFGRRLASVSLGGTPPVYEFATGTLDVTFRQEIGAGVGLRLAAKNVLGTDVRFGHTYKGEEFVTARYERGRTFSVGISYGIN